MVMMMMERKDLFTNFYAMEIIMLMSYIGKRNCYLNIMIEYIGKNGREVM